MRPLQAKWCVVLLSLMIFCSNLCSAMDGRFNHFNGVKHKYTITVDQSGKGNFTKIQNAIDSVPPNNNQWTRIRISPGTYKEKVTIPREKPFLFLEGAGRKVTTIVWNDHAATDQSVTFTSSPDNFVAKGITFKNNYNVRINRNVTQAVAARIMGDKSAFLECGFVGLQDTLWDGVGRHYYHQCYIEGSIDMIFGEGQSIFQKCIIYVNIGSYFPEGLQGFITAHRRMSKDEKAAFVFKRCSIIGNGKAYLGRPWGPYSRVIFANSFLSDVVVPAGWYPWKKHAPHEQDLTYTEFGNTGPGADTSKRVPWEKKLDASQLSHFLDIKFIDGDEWIDGQFA